MRTSYTQLKADGTDDGRRVALVVNGIMQGRLNVIVEFDVPDAASSVMVEDGRISELSSPLLVLGSSITSYAYQVEGQALVGVIPGPARVERFVLLG